MRPQSAGTREAGFPIVAAGIKALEQALGSFGSTTEEGMAILAALKTLAPKFGQPSGDLTRAALKQLATRANPMGTPGPDNAAAMQDMIRTRLKGAGVGAAPQAPPAAAPDAAA
jgi:hypothetical protein